MIILVGLKFCFSGPKRKRRLRVSAESGVEITLGGTLGELTRVSTAPRMAGLEGCLEIGCGVDASMPFLEEPADCQRPRDLASLGNLLSFYGVCG